ncbi:MAG: Ig-like domain-containing protein [[Bacteroides] pectinophilus]|nr:Ig-like domain-containing protein [[Bacteroides] pectinophilus]
MNKINVRKLKHMLKKYKKAAIFVAMLAVVGIGIGVAHVLAVSVAIKCANLELSKNGFYNIGDEGNKYTFNAEVSGLTVGGDVTKDQFSWDTDRSTLISVVPDTSSNMKFQADVTAKAAGFANVNVTFTPKDGSATQTASQGVYVPLKSTLKESTSGSATNDNNIYSAGTTFTLTSSNVAESNALRVVVYRYDGTELINTNGLGTDVVVSTVDYKTISITVNKSGVYKIQACTDDYLKNTDAQKVDRLMNEYQINTKVLFQEGTPSAAEGNFLTINKTTDGKKYCVIPDINSSYALMTNASSNGTPKQYGIRWNSYNTDTATLVDPDKSVYNMIKGKYAGISKITAGLSSTDVSGSDFFKANSTDDCYAVVPFVWGMEGFTTTDGVADKTVTMNVNDSYTLTTSGKPSAVTWGLTDTSTANVTNGVFSASKEGDYVVYATLAQSQFVGDSPELVNLMGKQTIQITIHVIDSFGISEDKHTLYVGDSFVLKAVTTDPDTPVTFTYKNLPPVTGGDVPKDKLVSLTDYKEDGSNVVTGTTIKGLKAGIVEITATQVVNNVTKTATCIVYVIDKPIEVTSLAIDPSSIQIDKGSNAILNVVFNKNASTPENMNVFWSSSDTDIVTVEGNGNLHTATITGKKGGTAVVMVVSQDGLYSATCTVSVREPVTGVTLNETSITASLSQKQFQLVPTVLPAGDGVNRNVTWSSTDPSVLTVDKNGLVTYKGTGYASVICTTEDGGYQAFCNFYVNIPVESLKLDYTDEIMSIGGQLRITAEILPLNASQRTVSWESSDTSVCTVDTNGLVKATGVGFATILCKTIDGSDLTAMCKIYVKQPVTSVVLNTKEIEVRKGTVFWLNATCLPENADNKLCAWTTSDKDVCTVDDDGKVTAVGSGTCNIVVTNVDTGISDYCVVTVTQPVTGITLNSDYQSMWVGSKYAIIPNVQPVDADNKKVTYQSSDTSVATVDADGVVTAVKGGTCVIIVTTDELQLKASVTIDVKEYVSSIKLSENNKYLNIGATGTLTATVGSDTATNKAIVWSSSNSGVCAVVDGTLYGMYPGVAVITATAADGSGVSDTCIVNVVNPVTSVSIEPEEVRILVGDYYKLKANIAPADATVQDLRWESSDESIATVDSDGEVLGIAVGKCRITAYSTDGNEVKGSCSVYVSPVVKISSLKINSSEITMLVGKTRKLSSYVTPTNTTESVNWYSTDTSIVVVDSEGTITTVGPGIADVVVYGGTTNVSTACKVHALALSKTSINLGQYDIFDLAVDGSDGFQVAWRTSNPRVATVDNTGHVVARMRGTTTITATVDNKTLTCVVNVGALY